jgi:hypothetical protein
MERMEKYSPAPTAEEPKWTPQPVGKFWKIYARNFANPAGSRTMTHPCKYFRRYEQSFSMVYPKGKSPNETL